MSRPRVSSKVDFASEYYHPTDHEGMSKRDAEIAVAKQVFDENPGMLTNEQAMKIGEEFVQNARHVNVRVVKGNRKGSYWGRDPYQLPSWSCWD